MLISSFRTNGFADLHVHLRQEDILRDVLPESLRYCDYILAMPNTTPIIDDGKALRQYKEQIMACPGWQGADYLLTFYLTESMKADDIQHLITPWLRAGKLYPKGLTTNSHDGIPWDTILCSPEKLLPVFREMSLHNLALCIHAEAPDSECDTLHETETMWICFLEWLGKQVPDLKVIVEHITTAKMADYVVGARRSNLAATVTPQHLLWVYADLFRDGLRPLRHCKPLYKFSRDRESLWDAVWNSRSIFLGSDSAPHILGKKVSRCCNAGVYTAPVLPELLAEAFEDKKALDVFEDFCCLRGPEFYGLSKSGRSTLLFRRESWTYNGNGGLPSPWDGYTFRWRAEKTDDMKRT